MLKRLTDARDRGASAIFIAFTMVVVMGMAALVIDATGAGFNERRQDQTAADTAVMAGAMGYVLGQSDVDKVDEVLKVARANLDTEYTDAEWQALWETCQDTDIDAVDVGTGTPEQFFPMANPFSPGTLECVSESSSYMRVVIPRQEVETTFGKVIGFDSVETYAVAIARIESDEDADGLIPFGIPGGSGDGEACLSANPSGPAEPPCQGPNAGGFGAINSEFFGGLFGSPSCSNPGSTELAQNVALGVDHFVDVWLADSAALEGVSIGDPHPGNGTVRNYTDVSYDQCAIVSGVVQPQQAGHEFPSNTFNADSGFSQAAAVESGLISDSTFLGQPSRLQNTSNPKQDLVKRRQGANNVVYELDDRGPWEYLTGNGLCSSSSYNGLDTDAKVARFQNCLNSYSGTTDIFDPAIGDSPRFAWAPQYWHAFAGTSNVWYPVERYRMVFIGGLWFNCDASVTGDCGAIFYPDTDDENGNAEICDAQGPNCQLLNLDQMSAWTLPDEAVPDSVKASFPSGETSPFVPTLYR
jgi:hypothetical protein